MKPKSSESWRVDAADQRRSSTDAMATSTAAANFLLFAGAGLWCRSPIPLIQFSICLDLRIWTWLELEFETWTLKPRDDHSRHSTQQHEQQLDECNNTQQQLKHLFLVSRRKTLKVSLLLTAAQLHCSALATCNRNNGNLQDNKMRIILGLWREKSINPRLVDVSHESKMDDASTTV